MTGNPPVGTAGGGQFHLHTPRVIAWPDSWFTITNVTVTEWAVIAGMLLIAALVGWSLRSGRKNRLQATVEWLLSWLENWYAGFLGGRRQARRFLPLLSTLFLFIFICTCVGLLPTAGYADSVFAPTARWGTTLGLALIVMITCQTVAIREMGWRGWVQGLLHMFPLGLLEEFIRPFSLSLRLFGNVFGEETLLAVLIFLAPMFAPVPIMALALLFGAIQAVVFTTLAASYIGDVLERAGERAVAAGQPHTQGGTQS